MEPSPPLGKRLNKIILRAENSKNFLRCFYVCKIYLQHFPANLEIFTKAFHYGLIFTKYNDLFVILKSSKNSLGQSETYLSLSAHLYLQVAQKDKALGIYKKLIKTYGPKESYQYGVNVCTGNQISQVPASIVENIYDEYARSFETILLNKLNYQGPDRLVGMLFRQRRLNFENVLDLGCGTGLFGKKLIHKFVVTKLTGVDISAAMLEKAWQKNIYSKLYCQELVDYLLNVNESYDLISMCDVAIYLGDLQNVLQYVANRLKSNGLLAFCDEELVGEDTQNYSLQQEGRFRHSHKYILGLARNYNLTSLEFNLSFLRTEANKEVVGNYFIFQKTGKTIYAKKHICRTN